MISDLEHLSTCLLAHRGHLRVLFGEVSTRVLRPLLAGLSMACLSSGVRLDRCHSLPFCPIRLVCFPAPALSALVFARVTSSRWIGPVNVI